MANGISGTRGGSNTIEMESGEKSWFLSSDLNGGMLGPYRKYMESKGFTPDEAEQVRNLLSAHGGSSAQQAAADSQIVSELESGSRLGQALEAKIDFEEGLYKEWITYNKKQESPWEKGIYNGQKQIYRKGDRKTGVEAWTKNEEGANMGSGGIGWDHKSTVEALQKEGYRILGGIGLMSGAPGEGEITFVKYKKKK